MNYKIIKVGRSSENDIVIADASVSSFHLELFFDAEGNIFLTDKNSTNGTFVNGVKVSESIQINIHDTIKAAKSEVTNWQQYIISKKISEQANSNNSFEQQKDSKIKGNKTLKRILISLGICLVLLFLFFIFNEYIFENAPPVIDPEKPNGKTDQPEKRDKNENKELVYDYSCLQDENDLGTSKVTDILSDIESESIKTFGGEISIEEEHQVGKDLLADCKNEYEFINDGVKYQNIKTILNTLVQQIPSPKGYNYSIYLIKSEELNAFTAGAKIFITTTMYDFCKSNDELACIIGHEINHNELGHIKESLQKEGMLGAEGAALNQMLTVSFGQKKELACDLHGIDLVIAAGYNGCVNISLWERMEQESNEGNFDPLENMFRSHPYSAKRSVCSKNHILTNYEFDCKN